MNKERIRFYTRYARQRGEIIRVKDYGFACPDGSFICKPSPQIAHRRMVSLLIECKLSGVWSTNIRRAMIVPIRQLTQRQPLP